MGNDETSVRYTAWTNTPTSVGIYWYRDLSIGLLTTAEVTLDDAPDADPTDWLAQIVGESEAFFVAQMEGEWQGPIVPGA